MRLLWWLVSVALVVRAVRSQSETICPPVDGKPSCVCKTPTDGLIIDLTKLSKSDGDAEFSGVKDPNDYTYSINPCSTFSEIECNNVFICQEDKYDSTVSFEIASGTEQIRIGPDGIPFLYYTGADSRIARVFLNCNKDLKTNTMTAIGDSQSFLNYRFDLTGPDVCPGAASSAGVAAGEVGIVLIVLLLAGTVGYFVVGAIIMKVKFNAMGSDIIPNKAFWFAVPVLIKDGFLFTFSPLINLCRGGGKGQYSEL